MAELKNTFSWSFSASSDFEDCRRKRYWAKYAMWGGWERNAEPLQKAAYRLTKMDSRFSLRGQAAEEAVLYALRETQRGNAVTVDRRSCPWTTERTAPGRLTTAVSSTHSSLPFSNREKRQERSSAGMSFARYRA